VDSSTKQLNQPQPDVEQSAHPSPLSTPQGAETPSKTPQPATNSFHPTAVTFPDDDVADARFVRPGAIIDGYVVVRLIANTKMSVVFQARQPGTNQLVALKLIQQGAFSDRESIERFQQEIVTLGKMQPHKNIMPIYHVGRHGNEPYYIMPFVAGGSLSHQMQRFHADRRKAVALIEKIARAVHQLHTQKPIILHRDIKPGNILLTTDDEPLLADFGLIKLLDDNQALTRTDRCPGTPAYMAPEQTGLVPTPVSERTDIWALGVVLYELLTRTRPFVTGEGEDSSKLFWKIVHEEPAAPRSLRPDIDVGLQAVVLKCLEKRAEDRFGSAEELADELGRWLRAEAVRTKRTPVRRFLHRYRWIAAALALFALAVTAAAVARHRSDPENELHNLQREFAENGTLDLVPEKGRPRWHERAIPTSVDSSGEHAGYWVVESMGIGVVDLLRDIPTDSYRVHAEIKHIKDTRWGANTGGGIGVFVAHHAKSPGPKARHFWCNLTFNDIVDEARKPQSKPGDIPGNLAQLRSRLFMDTEPAEPIDDMFGWVKPVRFKPALMDTPWRTVEIDVFTDRFIGRFDGVEMAPLNRALITSVAQDNLAKYQQASPARYATLGGIGDLELDPRGSLGLVVTRASLIVKNFRIARIPISN
jgi:serine/threonine-protein kinase